MRKLQEELNTRIKFKDEYSAKSIKPDEKIAIISGKLEDV